MTVNRTIPVLLVGTMVANLYFDTGMFAVVVVSVIWAADAVYIFALLYKAERSDGFVR